MARRTTFRICFGIVMAFMATAHAARADDWPQWRGPGRDGKSAEKNLLRSWPEGGPPLEWKAEGLGRGYASVAVVGDRIYTMGLRDNRPHLIALDARGGAVVWATPVGGEGEQAPNCTPTIDGDRVYGLTFQGTLACCSARDGKVEWTKDFAKDFGGRMMSGWGYAESPLIDGDRLVCTPGSPNAMLAALDKATGNPIWTTPVADNVGEKGQPGAAYASIVISRGGGVKQYVQLVGRGVIGVDAETGKLLWVYDKIANGTANCPTPVVSGNFVFASSGYGDGGSVLLELGRAGRGQVAAREVFYYTANQVQNHHGGMILIDEYLYMGHGQNNGLPLCLDLRTGQDAWRPGRGVGSGSAAVAYADGHLYFRYENGEMALIEATPKEYRVKGQFKLAVNLDRSWPHPAIADGRLYIRDQDVLLRYDVRGGK
ncbi:MAG: polyvinylalcohol dehydrogenase [Planctomycetes bacterium]|nr:polyvinylalcohol dehydrogenase [Planctomycetota bacterium]